MYHMLIIFTIDFNYIKVSQCLGLSSVYITAVQLFLRDRYIYCLRFKPAYVLCPVMVLIYIVLIKQSCSIPLRWTADNEVIGFISSDFEMT